MLLGILKLEPSLFRKSSEFPEMFPLVGRCGDS